MTTTDAPAPVAEPAQATPTPEVTPAAESAPPSSDPTKEITAQLDAGIDIEGLANAKIEDAAFQGENHKVKYDEVVASLPDDAKAHA